MKNKKKLMAFILVGIIFLTSGCGIDDYLNDNLICETGIFNQKEVRKLVRKFKSGRNGYLYNRIWQIILIQKFISDKFNK